MEGVELGLELGPDEGAELGPEVIPEKGPELGPEVIPEKGLEVILDGAIVPFTAFVGLEYLNPGI